MGLEKKGNIRGYGIGDGHGQEQEQEQPWHGRGVFGGGECGWVLLAFYGAFGYHEFCLFSISGIGRHSDILAMVAMGQFSVDGLCAVRVQVRGVQPWRRVLGAWAGRAWADPGGVWWVLWHGWHGMA